MTQTVTRESTQAVFIDRDGATPPTNASVACVSDGRALLVQRSLEEPSYPGYWEFPGGTIEPGESPSEAAVREFREECGCGVEIGKEVARFSWEAGGRRKTEVVFAGIPVGPIRLDRDHCDCAWVRSTDLVECRIRCSPETRAIALALLRETRRAVLPATR